MLAILITHGAVLILIFATFARLAPVLLFWQCILRNRPMVKEYCRQRSHFVKRVDLGLGLTFRVALGMTISV
ncbi:hypothetical protein V1520DRAFT_347092 [Lipomyces starkeyi]|uniref:Uncharacterized protein n=1 Tax=Lipomyces starkeyi NRRL Y-11557 TaxID=675824 RepID=A0A1E3Q6W9_LIPST|nr:hypothetical protein LIPSTDRAFT_71714 [Lipomyces starkeyi NRRL Y-11557]